MSDHYYSKDPHSKYITTTIHQTLRNHSFTFTTASSVFSKKGIDFGSRLLIESFNAPNMEGPLLDLGCGYGPIGITLGHTYPERSIVMVDINERAVELAKQNANQNQISNVTVYQSDGFVNVEMNTFAAIITNPPIRTGKKVIYPMFEKSVHHLQENGELWIVIQKKQGALSLIDYLQSIYASVETVTRKKGYYIIKATKEY